MNCEPVVIRDASSEPALPFGVASIPPRQGRSNSNTRRSLAHKARHYLVETLREGPKRLMLGRYHPRAGKWIIASLIPVLLTTLVTILPGVLFPTPQHREFFQFAQIIGSGSYAALPMILSIVSSFLCLRLPLG